MYSNLRLKENITLNVFFNFLNLSISTSVKHESIKIPVTWHLLSRYKQDMVGAWYLSGYYLITVEVMQILALGFNRLTQFMT